jgi:hypothetical protein
MLIFLMMLDEGAALLALAGEIGGCEGSEDTAVAELVGNTDVADIEPYSGE